MAITEKEIRGIALETVIELKNCLGFNFDALKDIARNANDNATTSRVLYQVYRAELKIQEMIDSYRAELKKDEDEQ